MTMMNGATGSIDAPQPDADLPGPARSRRTLWTTLTGTVGVVTGIAPHVLHHIAPLLGAAVLTGVGGTVGFAALGLAASIPFLLRLHRRFGTWWAPGVAVAVFAAMFLASSLWLGPLISGTGGNSRPSPTITADPADHPGHHPS